MSPVEKEIASRLRTIPTFANFKEGRFVDQLPNWHDRPMTDAGRGYLIRLLDRYADQIPDAAQLKDRYADEQLLDL